LQSPPACKQKRAAAPKSAPRSAAFKPAQVWPICWPLASGYRLYRTGRNDKLLNHLGKDVEPVAGGAAVMGESGRDRFIADAVNSIMARGAAKDEKGHVQIRAGNPLKGAKLAELARMCLAQANIKVDSMDQMKIVAAAFTQSTSDFPVLLESVMHKTLQQAYAVAPDTWSRFCAIGSVSDFPARITATRRQHRNLDSLNELGEFKNKTIPDVEKASITAGTKGNIINISRQIIVNDDLQALVTLTAMLGRAAKRSIEASVYALLAENSGAGPFLSDGLALFHSTHGNLVTSGAVPSIDTIEAARILMASQKMSAETTTSTCVRPCGSARCRWAAKRAWSTPQCMTPIPPTSCNVRTSSTACSAT